MSRFPLRFRQRRPLADRLSAALWRASGHIACGLSDRRLHDSAHQVVEGNPVGTWRWARFMRPRAERTLLSLDDREHRPRCAHMSYRAWNSPARGRKIGIGGCPAENNCIWALAALQIRRWWVSPSQNHPISNGNRALGDSPVRRKKRRQRESVSRFPYRQAAAEPWRHRSAQGRGEIHG
jgi:hypothetical protein